MRGGRKIGAVVVDGRSRNAEPTGTTERVALPGALTNDAGIDDVTQPPPLVNASGHRVSPDAGASWPAS